MALSICSAFDSSHLSPAAWARVAMERGMCPYSALLGRRVPLRPIFALDSGSGFAPDRRVYRWHLAEFGHGDWVAIDPDFKPIYGLQKTQKTARAWKA